METQMNIEPQTTTPLSALTEEAPNEAQVGLTEELVVTASGEAIATPEALPQKPPQKISEEQNALLVYQKNLNEFIRLLSTYPGSKSQVARAWINSAISPMNKEEFHFSYPEEELLFNLFNELNSAKFVLMTYGMAKEGKITFTNPENPFGAIIAEAAQAETASVINESVNTEEKKEETNG